MPMVRVSNGGTVSDMLVVYDEALNSVVAFGTKSVTLPQSTSLYNVVIYSHNYNTMTLSITGGHASMWSNVIGVKADGTSAILTDTNKVYDITDYDIITYRTYNRDGHVITLS